MNHLTKHYYTLTFYYKYFFLYSINHDLLLGWFWFGESILWVWYLLVTLSLVCRGKTNKKTLVYNVKHWCFTWTRTILFPTNSLSLSQGSPQSPIPGDLLVSTPSSSDTSRSHETTVLIGYLSSKASPWSSMYNNKKWPCFQGHLGGLC
jgi:hypothetical protein